MNVNGEGGDGCVINVCDYVCMILCMYSFELVVMDENGVERVFFVCGVGFEEIFEWFVESSVGNEGVILNLGERVVNDWIVFVF